MAKGIRAIKQAGIYNFLGKQKMVTVPIKWKSGKDHPDTELAYITKPEKELLIKLDMHGSMKDGKPNKGPGGIISLNSGGSGDGGSSGGSGGSGGSDATDTGDMGSEAANNAATDAANASVGAGDSGPTDPGPPATDTISSFGNNFSANMQSYGPLGYAVPGLAAVTGIQTAIQTNQARDMLGLTNPSTNTDQDNNGGGGGIAPYQAIQTTQPSSSLGSKPPSFNLNNPAYTFQNPGDPYNYQNSFLYKTYNKGGFVILGNC